MKITKKFKYSLISSLTVFASALSVVACGINNKIEPDDNYNNFVNSLKGFNLSNFAMKNSSFLNGFLTIDKKDPSLTTSVNPLNPLKTKVYNLSLSSKVDVKDVKSHNLIDFESGGISVDDNGIIKFKFDGKQVLLSDLTFSSNFNLTITHKVEGKNDEKMNFNNITAFFQLIERNKSEQTTAVKEVQWDQNIKFNPNNTFKDQFKLNESGDHIFNKKRSNLGINHKEGENNLILGALSPELQWVWENFPKGDTYHTTFFGMSKNPKVSYEYQGKIKVISATGNNFVVPFELSGSRPEYIKVSSAFIFGMFENNKFILKSNDNFLVHFYF